MSATHIVTAIALVGMAGCANPECKDILEQDSCQKRDDCMTIFGLACEQGEALGDFVYAGCHPREGCGDLVTYAEFDGQCHQYPSTCNPGMGVSECLAECRADTTGYYY